ncbi:MAG: ZIP family metal transporter [Candidatus Altiarchaeota archaeon]|nr:ZIP family metal transporter [Candidatus Altiarchaeota archaeon]
MALFEIIVSVVFISLLSFVGAISLALKRDTLNEFLLLFVAFASGSLLAVGLLDMIPESLNEIGVVSMQMVLVGILLFFLVEKFIHWHHCGKEECEMIKPAAYLNLVGDGVHNFIDGVVIAAAYLTSLPLGVVTTVAMALHEIPQEFGDFSVLIHSGMTARKALTYNFLSALTSVLGALVGYYAFSRIESWIPYVVAIAAGGFIYIATADLIPELHKETKQSKMVQQVAALLAGVLLLYVMLHVLPKA